MNEVLERGVAKGVWGMAKKGNSWKGKMAYNTGIVLVCTIHTCCTIVQKQICPLLSLMTYLVLQ
jgi:hypothetical protein